MNNACDDVAKVIGEDGTSAGEDAVARVVEAMTKELASGPTACDRFPSAKMRFSKKRKSKDNK
jgi:hypothetical protein